MVFSWMSAGAEVVSRFARFVPGKHGHRQDDLFLEQIDQIKLSHQRQGLNVVQTVVLCSWRREREQLLAGQLQGHRLQATLAHDLQCRLEGKTQSRTATRIDKADHRHAHFTITVSDTVEHTRQLRWRERCVEAASLIAKSLQVDQRRFDDGSL